MKYIPEDLTTSEYLVAYRVLGRIKTAILQGKPSGVVIDKALDEAFELGTKTSR